tara:strand:- start:1188 stop:1508 length:321 start_codon:yes stop_codon:yes gene_type:complete
MNKVGRPIAISTEGTWDQRIRADWNLASTDGTDVLLAACYKLSDKRRTILMKRYGISDDGTTVPPLAITTIAAELGVSKQNIAIRLLKTQIQISHLLNFIRQGGKL